MYREKIREYYDHLSRSYRRVADYIMSNYYDVSFMTAAQLAFAVGVDTTTVVRFSQRLGYNGYPELLNDIRDQVRQKSTQRTILNLFHLTIRPVSSRTGSSTNATICSRSSSTTHQSTSKRSPGSSSLRGALCCWVRAMRK